MTNDLMTNDTQESGKARQEIVLKGCSNQVRFTVYPTWNLLEFWRAKPSQNPSSSKLEARTINRNQGRFNSLFSSFSTFLFRQRYSSIFLIFNFLEQKGKLFQAAVPGASLNLYAKISWERLAWEVSEVDKGWGSWSVWGNWGFEELRIWGFDCHILESSNPQILNSFKHLPSQDW